MNGDAKFSIAHWCRQPCCTALLPTVASWRRWVVPQGGDSWDGLVALPKHIWSFLMYYSLAALLCFYITAHPKISGSMDADLAINVGVIGELYLFRDNNNRQQAIADHGQARWLIFWHQSLCKPSSMMRCLGSLRCGGSRFAVPHSRALPQLRQ